MELEKQHNLEKSKCDKDKKNTFLNTENTEIVKCRFKLNSK